MPADDEERYCPVCGRRVADIAVTPYCSDHCDYAAERDPMAERCPSAHPGDRTPCRGPIAVTVLTAQNAGATGCEHHAARLLASLPGGRAYSLPDAPEGAALRVFKAAAHAQPYDFHP